MADMFTIPASAMRDIIESLDANPITYTYPHMDLLFQLSAALPPGSQPFIDFANHVGALTSDLYNSIKQAEAVAERIADYDGVTTEDALNSMVGSLLPDFAFVIEDWIVRAADAGNHNDIFAEMTAITVNEPAATARAREITAKISQTMAIMRSVESSSPAGQVALAAMGANAAGIIQQGLKTLSALQQIANFGTSMPPPGQEFKKYLEGLSSSIQSAISGGNIQMIDGALKLVGADGLAKVIPSGIVDSFKTLVPDAGKLLDQVTGVVKTVDTSISEAQRAINKLKGQS